MKGKNLKQACVAIIKPFSGKGLKGNGLFQVDGKNYSATLDCDISNFDEVFDSVLDLARTMILAGLVDCKKAFRVIMGQ